MSRTDSFLRDLAKAARWHRRLLAGLSAAAAVYCALAALSPPPAPTVAVLAAARDLPGGSAPADADLRTLQLPAPVVPTGVLRPGTDVTKRVLAGPVRSGEPLTDARFLTPTALPTGQLAYPVRLDDPDLATLLQVGDRIDLYAATSTTSASAIPLARAAPVLALPTPRASSSTGALIVIAADRETITRIAQATANSRLTIAVTHDTS
ncbi:SAF domain-containing protein [Kribbella sancticallisti]|uniref:SAF domain-containing protein n=1 Tax=Kribbella sancticallisti TaxID=460087 RepID=A0ABP4QPJ8_9ACTN